MNLRLIHFMAARLAALALLALGLFAAPLASAQSGRTYRVGFVSVASASTMAPRVDAFRGGLRDLGYVEGQNLSIEFRWGGTETTNGCRVSWVS
jgi:putative ABC transport system substrate-binding protein